MEKINALVQKVITIYMKEDYDYMVGMAKKGERAESLNTMEFEVDFINRNHLADNMSEEDIMSSAKIILGRLTELETETYKKYNKEVIRMEGSAVLTSMGEVVGESIHEGYIKFFSKETMIRFLNDKTQTIPGVSDYDVEMTVHFNYYFEGYNEIWVIRPNQYRIISNDYGDNTPDTEWISLEDMPEPVYEDSEIKMVVLF